MDDAEIKALQERVRVAEAERKAFHDALRAETGLLLNKNEDGSWSVNPMRMTQDPSWEADNEYIALRSVMDNYLKQLRNYWQENGKGS